MPLVYGLLPGKAQVLCSNFLIEFDTFCDFEPQSVLCHFERSLHSVISSV